MTRIEIFLLRNGGGTDKGGHRKPKRREIRREEKAEEKRSQKREDGNREMVTLGSFERSPGSGTQWLDPRGGRREFGPSGWIGSGLPQRWLDTGTRRGLSILAPWKRNHRLPDERDSGIGTGGTHGPGLTGGSGVPEALRVVDASTPMSRGMGWTCRIRVSRYYPIMDGQPSQSPPQMALVDPGGVVLLLKTPGMGVKGELTSLQGAGVPGTVISPVGQTWDWAGCRLRAGLAGLPTRLFRDIRLDCLLAAASTGVLRDSEVERLG